MEKLSEPAATVTFKNGNWCTQQVTNSSVMQKRNYTEKEAAGGSTGVSREDNFLEVHYT
jgi:hypothetical protein